MEGPTICVESLNNRRREVEHKIGLQTPNGTQDMAAFLGCPITPGVYGTFQSKRSRRAYLARPEHENLLRWFGRVLHLCPVLRKVARRDAKSDKIGFSQGDRAWLRRWSGRPQAVSMETRNRDSKAPFSAASARENYRCNQRGWIASEFSPPLYRRCPHDHLVRLVSHAVFRRQSRNSTTFPFRFVDRPLRFDEKRPTFHRSRRNTIAELTHAPRYYPTPFLPGTLRFRSKYCPCRWNPTLRIEISSIGRHFSTNYSSYCYISVNIVIRTLQPVHDYWRK